MIYLTAVLGFIFGFFAGQILLQHLLRGRSRDEILKMMKDDKSARWKYGSLNWLIAVLGAIVSVWAYKYWFS